MPHHRSAVKRLRQAAVARQRNRFTKSTLRTAIKRLRAEKDVEKARAALSRVHGQLDRAAKRHVLHGGTAARLKSRLAQHVNRLAG